MWLTPTCRTSAPPRRQHTFLFSQPCRDRSSPGIVVHVVQWIMPRLSRELAGSSAFGRRVHRGRNFRDAIETGLPASLFSQPLRKTSLSSALPSTAGLSVPIETPTSAFPIGPLCRCVLRGVRSDTGVRSRLSQDESIRGLLSLSQQDQLTCVDLFCAGVGIVQAVLFWVRQSGSSTGDRKRTHGVNDRIEC